MREHKSVWLSLALFALTAVLVSCAQSQPIATPALAPTPTISAAGTPPTVTPVPTPAVTLRPTAAPSPASPTKPQGTLTIALPTLREENFLPSSGSSSRVMYYGPIYDGLIFVKHDTGEKIPGLATRWEVSPDGKVWTFWLRKGVQFHGGWGEVTAQDVKFSLEHYMIPASKAPSVGWFRDVVEKIEVTDPYQVKIYLKEVSALLLVELSEIGGGGAYPILSKRYIESAGAAVADEKPIGSGPYRFVERRPGDYIKFEAVEDHWRVVPEFKYLIFKKVPEEATRMAMLQKGEADIAPVPSVLSDKVKDAGLRVVVAPKSYVPYAVLGGNLLPGHKFYDPNNKLLDKRIREALNISINRDEIAQYFYKGFATPASTVSGAWGVKDVPKAYPYDQAKAKRLLADAGYPNGFELTMYAWAAVPGAELPQLAEGVASYWEKIGVRVKLQQVEAGTVNAQRKNGDFAGKVMFNRLMDLGDPQIPFTLYHHSKLTTGPQFFDKRLDELIATLVVTTEPAKREQLSREITQFLYDEYANVPIVAVADSYGMSQKVGEWPFVSGSMPFGIHWEYITHSSPLRTFRLFQP